MAEPAYDVSHGTLDFTETDERTWEEWYESLSEDEQLELSRALATGPQVAPQHGPQTLAYNTPAVVTGFGGAAGGGKTSLAVILAMNEHERTVAFRFEKEQLRGMMDIATEYMGTDAGLNRQAGVFRFGDRNGHLLEFGGVGGPGDEKRWQGREHDLIVFDEATEIPRAKFMWLKAWNRTAKRGQRCRILLTFNPPETQEGRWVVDYFAPWLDERHPNPAKPGEVRWFVTDEDGNEVEVPDGTPYKIQREDRSNLVEGPKTIEYEVVPESRTFYPARAFDNKFVSEQYISTLNSLEEPHRTRMMLGDFRSGIVDKPYQIIPADWVDEAMQRHRDAFGAHGVDSADLGVMDALGIDVARGGRAHTVWAPRHGLVWPKLHRKPGTETKSGRSVGMPALELVHNRGATEIMVDANGVGSSAYDFLNETWPRVRDCFMQGAAGDLQQFEDTKKFLNLRIALYWLMRKILDPERNLRPMLPPDNRLRSELIAPCFDTKGGRMFAEDKKAIEKRLHHSIDEADAVVLTLRNIAAGIFAERLMPSAGYDAGGVTPHEPAPPMGDWMAV